MRSSVLWVCCIWLCVAAPCRSQPADPKVQGAAPWVMLAQATDKEGVVTLTLWHAVPQPSEVVRQVAEGGKNVQKKLLVTEVEWDRYEVTADGKSVRAATADGKTVAPKELLNRLAVPTPAAIFIFDQADMAQLKVFRSDTVVVFIPEFEKLCGCSPNAERRQ